MSNDCQQPVQDHNVTMKTRWLMMTEWIRLIRKWESAAASYLCPVSECKDDGAGQQKGLLKTPELMEIKMSMGDVVDIYLCAKFRCESITGFRSYILKVCCSDCQNLQRVKRSHHHHNICNEPITKNKNIGAEQ